MTGMCSLLTGDCAVGLMHDSCALELAISRQFKDVLIFLLSQQLVELYQHLAARYNSASLSLQVCLMHVIWQQCAVL